MREIEIQRCQQLGETNVSNSAAMTKSVRAVKERDKRSEDESLLILPRVHRQIEQSKSDERSEGESLLILPRFHSRENDPFWSSLSSIERASQLHRFAVVLRFALPLALSLLSRVLFWLPSRPFLRIILLRRFMSFDPVRDRSLIDLSDTTPPPLRSSL